MKKSLWLWGNLLIGPDLKTNQQTKSPPTTVMQKLVMYLKILRAKQVDGSQTSFDIDMNHDILLGS